jgi:hypothetical protein
MTLVATATLLSGSTLELIDTFCVLPSESLTSARQLPPLSPPLTHDTGDMIWHTRNARARPEWLGMVER